MRIQTLNFGEIEIPEERVMRFKEGIPGFPQLCEFAILDVPEVKPFLYLQALGKPAIALLVINPFLVNESYKFDLTPADMEAIQATRPEEAAVYAVVTIPEDHTGTTINLMAPLVLNEKARWGKQVILHDSGNSVRHPLLGGSQPDPSGSLFVESPSTP